MESEAASFAQVEVLPPTQADRILSGRAYRIVQGFNTISPLLLVGALALVIFWGMPLLGPDSEARESVRSRIAVPLLALAGVTILVALTFASRNYWLQRIARREIWSRPDRAVDPKAPGSRFVEVVPRSNWNKGMRENASDVGFLAVNAERRCLLFEGDCERYRIPAKAIVKAEQDDYTLLEPGKRGTLIYRYFVVVTVRTTKNTTAEIPFRIRGLFSGTRQRTETFELLKAIHQLSGATSPQASINSSRGAARGADSPSCWPQE